MLNTDISVYITVDSRKVGYYMATILMSKISTGNIICIYGPEEDFNMRLIDIGVNSVLSQNPLIRKTNYYTDGWNYDLSYTKMTELLDSGIRPEAVISGNDAIAETVIRALSEHRLGNSIPVVGQDADIAACQRVVDDIQTATIYKPISDLAKKAAEVAYLLGSGTKPEDLSGISETINNGLKEVPVLWLEPVLVTKNNIDEVVLNSGFHTKDDVYRNGK